MSDKNPTLFMNPGGIVLFIPGEEGKPRIVGNVDVESDLQTPERVMLWTLVCQQKDMTKQMKRCADALERLEARAQQAPQQLDINQLMEAAFAQMKNASSMMPGLKVDRG